MTAIIQWAEGWALCVGAFMLGWLILRGMGYD